MKTTTNDSITARDVKIEALGADCARENWEAVAPEHRNDLNADDASNGRGNIDALRMICGDDPTGDEWKAWGCAFDAELERLRDAEAG